MEIYLHPSVRVNAPEINIEIILPKDAHILAQQDIFLTIQRGTVLRSVQNLTMLILLIVHA